MSKHSPGPWTLIRKSVEGVQSNLAPASADWFEVLYDKDYGGPFGVICHIQDDHPQDEANARIIAAAPDLLDALKSAADGCACSAYEKFIGHRADCFVPKAETAIRKAEQGGV